MKAKTKLQTIKAISLVSALVHEEIIANAQGGKYSAGLSSEGFAGGYLEALQDVSGFMLHGFPSDHRGYFRRALAAKEQT